MFTPEILTAIATIITALTGLIVSIMAVRKSKQVEAVIQQDLHTIRVELGEAQDTIRGLTR